MADSPQLKAFKKQVISVAKEHNQNSPLRREFLESLGLEEEVSKPKEFKVTITPTEENDSEVDANVIKNTLKCYLNYIQSGLYGFDVEVVDA